MTIVTTKGLKDISAFIGTLVLLLPIGWFVLEGPNLHVTFFIGGILALIEMARTGSLRQLGRAWVIPLTVCIYVVTGWIAPEVDIDVQMLTAPAAVGSMLYGVPAGFCFANWSRKSPGAVLLAYIIFALSLSIAANGLIQTVGIRNIMVISENQLVRANPDSSFVFLGIFKTTNVIIGIVPMTLFAIAAVPLLLLPGWNSQKLLVIIASIAGVYANILVATRTILLAAALSFTCILTLVYLKEAIKRSRMILMLSLCIASGAILTKGLDLSNLFDPLSGRLSQLLDDSRFDIWKESAILVWNNPLGGGTGKLASAPWAHDLFLDCGLTNGWIGMISMLVQFGFVFYSMLRVIQRTDILTHPLGVIFLSAFLAGFFVALTMPPNAGLIAFSYMTCCYCLAIKDKVATRYLARRAGIWSLSGRRLRRGEVNNA